VPRSDVEVDRWIDKHEKEHDGLEMRLRGIVRDESADALEGMKRHVSSLETKVSSVETETKGQTATINAIKVHTDTLVAQSIESAEERGRRKERDEERMKRQTEAEIALKKWQSRAVPIGFVIAVVTAILTFLVKR
jgi:hypothetical protein